MPAPSTVGNVSTGAIDAGLPFLGDEIGRAPASALVGATPFGLECADFLAPMSFHARQDLLNEPFAPTTSFPSPRGATGPEGASRFRAEIADATEFLGRFPSTLIASRR